MGFTPSHGTQIIRGLETMWRFPPPEHCNNIRPLSHAAHTRPQQIKLMPKFSQKLTLSAGIYHYIPVHPNDTPKMAVITPFGLWNFLRIPFGLNNAAQTFQWLINPVLQGLDFAFVYINDILVASHSKADHRTHLQQVFHHLQQWGLVLNLAKCNLASKRLISWDITSRNMASLCYTGELLTSIWS